jgi:hypothetical protein
MLTRKNVGNASEKCWRNMWATLLKMLTNKCWEHLENWRKNVTTFPKNVDEQNIYNSSNIINKKIKKGKARGYLGTLNMLSGLF